MNTENMDAEKFFEEELGIKFHFGVVLKAYRTREGLTQKELSKKLEVSRSYVGDLEHGRKLVSLSQAVEFARKLGESEEYFGKAALEDQIEKTGINWKIEITAA